jgi:C4-dicarboxylate-binding protein DctP
METIPKRIIAACLAAAAIFFISCEQKQENEPADSMDKQEQKIYELKFGHDSHEASAQHMAALRFADIVKYKSEGRIKVEVFPEQKLGTDQEMLEAIRSGQQAIGLPPTAKMTTLVPEMRYLDLPFLFQTRQDLYEMLDGEPGQMLLDRLKPYGLIGVAFWESGFKQFTANKEIHTPKDFQGLNIRVMKSQTIMEQFQAFGANPIPVDFHQTYQALKDGVVDGEENPLGSIVTMKFHEVQSHIIISNHAYLAQAFVFSRKVLESLPLDIQEILTSTAIELTPFARNETIEREAAFIQTIKDHGTQVYTLTPQERTLFQEATKPIVERYGAIGADILDKTRELLSKKYQTMQNEIIIGLNADMVSGSALSGLSIKRGMELAVNEINQQGGVLGKTLKIAARNNSGITPRGIANFQYFSTLKNLVAVMGGIFSPIAIAGLPIIHREKILFLDPWSAATIIVDNGYTPNYVFRVSVRDEYAGPFLVDQALKKGYRRIAMLLVDDGWGHSNKKAITDALAERKLKPVVVEWFNWGQKDMSLQLDRIEEADADVILLVAGAPEGISIVKSMAKRSKRLPIISHWGITGGYFWEHVNQELESVSLRFLQSFSFMNPKNEKTKQVIKKYFEDYHVDHPGKIFAPVGTAHAYDLVHMLAVAIEQAGSVDRAAVRDALERIGDYEGIVTDYSPPFTPQRHDALDQSSYFLAEFNKQGHIIPVTK